jgi:hypothetical protein
MSERPPDLPAATNRNPGEPLLEAALGCAGRGWLVFTVRLDKAPATPHGFKDAVAEPEAVRELWGSHPGAGIGIQTGALSGLLVLDVDTNAGGDDTLHELECAHGELPATVEALTGGGGRHLYYRHPGDEVRCSAGRLGPGLDVRADGGYVVAPPSPHPSGRNYQWEVSHDPDDVPLAEPPGWLLDLLRDRPGGAPVVTDAIPEGRRNSTLTSLAGSMRRRGMGQSEIAAALRVTNHERCAPPLDEDEVERIAASVARYEPAEDPEEAEETVADRPFAVLTARQLCELPDPPESDYLLGPLLLRGARTVLGAHTGEGKTTLALELVRAVAMRDEFLEWTGAAGRALVIDAEQGLRTIKRRLREVGLDKADHVDYLRVPDGLALDQDRGHVYRLEEILTAHDYALVVADPLYKLHRGDSNEERHAVDLMRQLDRWRSTFGFCLLMLVRLRKPPPQGAMFTIHEFFGSSAYLRGAEVALGIRRKRPGYAYLHFFKDRDGDLPVGEAWGLLFDRDDGFRRDPTTVSRKRPRSTRCRNCSGRSPVKGSTPWQARPAAQSERSGKH